MKERNILLTVFTPTYNRGAVLNKCYESLCLLLIEEGELSQSMEERVTTLGVWEEAILY
ncbi:hypothetical protein [Clostridium sp. FP1]|uniref:hypothetical protein n=1 Tax=Clostridium sp. FP1 TaxID=2724076 RepID=UPI001CCDF9BD|nr:hypothetical protein [Clostridium sp. FP1]MBZ9636624.1 hypothetical protein [Clostridium sp. FP1]